MSTRQKERKEPRTKPVPIRLDSAMRARLGRAAERLASNKSAVIRLAIIQFLPDIEAGQIRLK